MTGSDVEIIASSHGGGGNLELELGNVSPGRTVAGWWELECKSKVQVSNITSSIIKTKGNAISDVVIRSAPVKAESTGGFTKQDLLDALERLRQATLLKLDGDRQRTAWFVAEAAKIMRELDPLAQAWADLEIWQNEIALSTIMLRYLEPAVPDLSEIDESIRSLHDYTIPQVSNVGTVRQLWEILRDNLSEYDRATWASTWLGIPAQMSPGDAAAWIYEYLDLHVPYYLPKSYVFAEYSEDFAELDDQQVLERLIDVAQAEFPMVYGIDTMKKAIDANLVDAIQFIEVMPELPALYPVDALVEELERLAEAMERTSQGWGIPEVNRTTGETVRQPVAWYSVGEKRFVQDPDTGQDVAAWMPMHLQPWEFGSTFEACYALEKVFEHQYTQFSLEWDLLATMMATQVWTAGMDSSSDIFSPAMSPGMGGIALLAELTSNAINNEALTTVKTHQNTGFRWMYERLYQLFDTQVYEDMGVWRMSWDVLNHLQYLYENPREDPPVPVFVESVYTPDVVLGDGDLVATQTGYAVVRNDADFTVDVSPTIHLFNESVDLGSITAETITIAPGETTDFRLPYGGLSSALTGTEGYDVEIFLEVADPDTMTTGICGPYHSHYFVGTRDELDLLGRQSVRVVHSGDINEGDRREAVFTPSGTTRRMRLLLSQSETANLDLHVYDSAGNHVGFDYDAGQADLDLPGGEYHGSDGIAEWIWIDVPGGEQYRVVVEATSAPLDTQFTVTVLETPEFPALLYLPIADTVTDTNERTVELSFGAGEYGGQRGIVGLSAVATDLVDGQGNVVPVANVSFDLPETTIPAGRTVGWSATVEIPGALPDGTYTGVFTLAGNDAVDGASLSEIADITIVLDTTAPAAPVLDEIGSPVTDGPAPVRGTVESSTIVELLLDGEHLTYAPAGADGNLACRVDIPAGTYTLTARAGDGVGNWSGESNAVAVVSTVDLTAPVTTPVVTGADNGAGWYGSDAVVELGAEDEAGGSGLYATHYSFNGGIEWHNYTDPFALTDEGEHTVWYYSEDSAGNKETIQVLTIGIDRIAPTSRVVPLPEVTTEAEFPVQWVGRDGAGGSGLGSYDIYVSTDGGEYVLWLDDTTETEAAFTGEDDRSYRFYSLATDNVGNVELSHATARATELELSAVVLARRVLYNNSVWDGYDPAADSADDAAIAPDKRSLLPGQIASPANITSYDKGINGIVLDVRNLVGIPTADDFTFRAQNTDDPNSWIIAPAATSVTVRPGQGVDGSARVTIIWADYAIVNRWLEVKFMPGANTGLEADDVSYLGSCIADADGNGKVGSSDYGALTAEFGLTGDVGALRADFNGDGMVDLDDFAIASDNEGNSISEPPVLPGDADGNGVVDSIDCGIMIGQFGLRRDGLAADFNGDGRVDLGDFGILRANYGDILWPSPPPAPQAAAGTVATGHADGDPDEPISFATATASAGPSPAPPIIAQLLAEYPVDDASITSAASKPVVDLLVVESPAPGALILEPRSVAVGYSATTLYRAATPERNWQTLEDELLPGSAEGLGDGLYIPIGGDDLLPDLLAESPAAV